MKERILFISIGQCGGNIGLELEKKDFNVLYINTSATDLQGIDSKFKFHIPGATGCAKDRELAVDYVANFYHKINNYINERFSSQDFVFLIGSMGGGTGSGIMPVLLSVLNNKNPNKHYGAVCVFPSLEEDYRSHKNSMECFKQLVNTKALKNLYCLDNNKQNKFLINEQFADIFDRFISSNQHNKAGNVDNKELETMLKTRGNSLLFEFEEFNNVDDLIKDNIFTIHRPGAKIYSFSLTYQFEKSYFYNKFGLAETVFEGVNEDNNIVGIFGMPWPRKRMEDLADSVTLKAAEVYQEEEEYDFDIPTRAIKQPLKEENKEEDIMSLINRYK